MAVDIEARKVCDELLARIQQLETQLRKVNERLEYISQTAQFGRM